MDNVRLIYCVLCILTTEASSPLTDGEISNSTEVKVSCESQDVLKQLINQETLIRISFVRNIRSLMADMVKMKQNFKSMQQDKSHLEQNITDLKTEVQLLKEENSELRSQNQNYHEQFLAMEESLQKIKGNVSLLDEDRLASEKEIDKKRQVFENSTKDTLADLRIDFRYMSLTLLNLNKHTLKLEQDIKGFIEETCRKEYDILNETINILRANYFSISLKHGELADMVGVLERSQLEINRTISDEILDKIDVMKGEVKDMHYDHLKLSSTVSSLEVFRMNLSISKCFTQQNVGFTAGIVSGKSIGKGVTLVYPKIVYNEGEGYNPSTGIFTSPTDGVFVFYISILSASNKDIWVDLVLNNVSKVRALAYSMSVSGSIEQAGSNLVLLQLKRGDKVWAKTAGGKGYHSHSVPIVTFSGFQIF